MLTPPKVAISIRPIPPSSTHALRHGVLWPDKPLEYVILDEDANGWHFGAFVKGVEYPVSVISCFLEPLPEHVAAAASSRYPTGQRRTGRFRKFATAPEWQGKGVGTALLQHALDFLTSPIPGSLAGRAPSPAQVQGSVAEGDEAVEGGVGCLKVWCDARWEARGFYARFGMRVVRPPAVEGEKDKEREGGTEGPSFYKGHIPYVRMMLDVEPLERGY